MSSLTSATSCKAGQFSSLSPVEAYKMKKRYMNIIHYISRQYHATSTCFFKQSLIPSKEFFQKWSELLTDNFHFIHCLTKHKIVNIYFLLKIIHCITLFLFEFQSKYKIKGLFHLISNFVLFRDTLTSNNILFRVMSCDLSYLSLIISSYARRVNIWTNG